LRRLRQPQKVGFNDENQGKKGGKNRSVKKKKRWGIGVERTRQEKSEHSMDSLPGIHQLLHIWGKTWK